MTDRLQLVTLATRSLFCFAAGFWLLVAVLIGAGKASVGVADGRVVSLLVILMVGGAVVLAFLGWGTLRGFVWIDGLAVVVSLANIVLTLADDVGWYDMGYLVFSIALLAVLVWALIERRSARAADARGPIA